MKTNRMIVATAITATLFALGACSNSDEPNVNVVDLTKPIDLRMESAIVVTRSLISEGATTFEAGDKVGIYLGAPADNDNPTAPASGKYKNMEYTLGGQSTPGGQGGQAWTGAPIYWQSATQKHTLYAYYPFAGTHGTAAVDNKLPVSIAQDQNADAGKGYKAADYMWKRVVVAPTNSSVALTLDHRMSLIKVTMTAGAGFDELSDVAKLTPSIRGSIYKAGTWNLADGTIAATTTGADATYSEITPYVVDKSADAAAPSLTYYAIVMPGTLFSNGSEFVSLAATDGTTYAYKLALTGGGNLATKAGEYYHFTLTAKKAGIVLNAFTIGKWTLGKDENGDADMVVPQP